MSWQFIIREEGKIILVNPINYKRRPYEPNNTISRVLLRYSSPLPWQGTLVAAVVFLSKAIKPVRELTWSGV